MSMIEGRSAGIAKTASSREELQRLVQGFQVSQAIHAAVVLGLPDLLASGPRSALDLALATQADPEALCRMMRVLVAVGVMREIELRKFEMSTMGAALRTDDPHSIAPIVRLQCRSSHWQAWGNLLHSVSTGATAFDHVHDMDVWAFRATHREEGDAFDNAMAAFALQVSDAFLKVCDLGDASHVVDVGGGDGTFLARILEANAHLQGTVFDLPQVAERARMTIDSAHLDQRCEIASGDFFKQVPGGGDVYILKWVLHDWDDAAALRILRKCRNAMTVDCRLIIMEHLAGLSHASPFVALRDLQMLVFTGGRERTRDEFEGLLADAGFAVHSVVETTAAVSTIEAVAL